MYRIRQFVTISWLTLPILLICFVMDAAADPLPGEIRKFSQLPENGVTLPTGTGTVQQYWGHDELSTVYGPITAAGAAPTVYRGRFMADDFADKFSTPVVHIRWWGSYLNNFTQNLPVDKFLISFESDVPDPNPTNPADFSRPGQPLLNQVVKRGPLAPGSGTFTETAISLGGPPLTETLYEYNAELHLGKEFFQKPDTVYWLKIAAMVDLPPALVGIVDPINPPTFVPRWGWHNRDFTVTDPLASTAPAVIPGEHIDGFIGPVPGGIPIWHFQDDAVTGIVTVDAAGPMGGFMPFITQTEFRPTRYLSRSRWSAGDWRIFEGPSVRAVHTHSRAGDMWADAAGNLVDRGDSRPAVAGLML